MTTTSKMGAATLALSLLAGSAAANCVPQADLTALQVAALRQQLMVAGLTCRDSAAFNRFVTSYQGELQKSDATLLSFFARAEGGKGDDAYNAYKTKLANRMSLSSLNDPRFCGMARTEFNGGLSRDLPLSEVVSEQRFPIAIGYASCTRDSSEIVRDADAAAVAHRRAWQREAMNQTPDPRVAEQAPSSDGYAPDDYTNDSDRDDSRSRRIERRRELRAERDDRDDDNDAPQAYADAAQMRGDPQGYDRRRADAHEDSNDRDSDDDGPYANEGPAFYGNPYSAPYDYGPPPPPPDRWRGGW